MANTSRTTRVRCANGVATTAQVNAGFTIVAPDAVRSLIVVGGWIRCAGSASGATSVDICDTAGSPVSAITVPVATATSGTICTPTSSNVTATNLGIALTAGKGLQVKAVGTLATTTAVDYSIQYMVV